MALIRTQNMKSPLDEMPNFYDPSQMAPTQIPTAPAMDWNLYPTQNGAVPIPQTRQQSAPTPTQWPTQSLTPMPQQAPTQQQAPGPDDWDNNWANYWAPDRREKLLSLLEHDYHAADKQQRIDWLKNLSDAELWPHGKPGGATPPTTPTPPPTTPPNYTAPPGVDQTKLNDPTHVTDKYRAVRILLGGGGIDEVLKELGSGWTKVSNDTIRAPDGSLFDLYFDFGGPQQRVQWTQVGAPGGTPPPPTPPTSPTSPTTPAAPGQPPAPVAPNLNAPTSPTQQGTQPPLVTPQQSQIPTISWAPGTKHTWQALPNTLPAFTRVANALSRALGRAPTPDEVWAQMDYDKLPDSNFVNSIVNHILDTVPPDPQTQQSAPGQQGPTDPYLEEYQRYLDEYLKTLASQRDQKERDNQTFRERQTQAQAATERLIKFLEERSQKLLQPAYTGAEGEVFRTKALDPIEADRQAAKQRALQRISERGLDPKSGIAQQLLNDVDAAFDKSRAGTQNQLAYNQITEQRSREQESQQLLGMIPQIQRAALNGDVEFLDMLDQQIRNTYKEGMGPEQLKYNIPNDALQQALAALGLGPNPMQLLTLLMQQQQYGQNNSNALYGALGSMLPYLLSAFGGGNTSMPKSWTGGT